MAILSFKTQVTGEVGLEPNLVRVISDDSLATVTTAGYLNSIASQGFAIRESDIVMMYYGTNSASFNFFIPSISNGVITLSEFEPAGNLSYTGTWTSGRVPQYSATTGVVQDSGLAANTILTSAIVSPDTSIDLVSFDVTVDQADLASGGTVTIFASSGTKSYTVRELYLNNGGTNFSGGGGDRLLSIQVVTGNPTFSVIPAATLQSLTNSRWGDTALPFPAVPIYTPAGPGESIICLYSGGTTDYTDGSLVLSGILQRIA
jgi:hypothetical protein